jgi:hypothetical protein
MNCSLAVVPETRNHSDSWLNLEDLHVTENVDPRARAYIQNDRHKPLWDNNEPQIRRPSSVTDAMRHSAEHEGCRSRDQSLYARSPDFRRVPDRAQG